MKTQLTRLALFAAAFVLLCSVSFVISQTARAVAPANAVSPALGQALLIVLLIVHAIVIFTPAIMYVRPPRAMRPPADEQSAEYQT